MQLIITALFVLNLAWGIALNFEPTHVTYFNYFYNLSYGLSYLLSALICINYAGLYPRFMTPMIFMGISFILFFLAQLIWVYFNLFLSKEIPYPSIADYFWISFYPLLATGFIILIQKFNTKFTTINVIEILILGSLSFFLLSSFLDLNSTQDNLPLITQFLNYFYPVADSLLIALGISTLRNQVGNLNLYLLYFIFGFIILAAGDTTFAYQTSFNTYWNGNIADLFYAISGILMLQGIYKLPKSFSLVSSKSNLS